MNIIVISGELYQAFLARAKQKRSYQQKGYIYRTIEAAQEANPERMLFEHLRASNLFARQQCIEVNIEDINVIKRILKQTLRKESEDAILFFAPGQKQPNISSKEVSFLHYELPHGAKLRTFIEQECKKRSFVVPLQLLPTLILLPKKTGNLFALMNEIEKISLAPRHFQELFFMQRNDNPFAITDAISKKNSAQALSLLEREFSVTQKPIDILNRILWQLRVLLLVKSVSADKSAGLPFHPFVIQKARQALGFFSLSELITLYTQAISLYERLLFSGLPSQILLSQFFWKM